MGAPFKIGDQLWWARWEPYHEERIPCPICYGKREVTVVLGNGDLVIVECDYCGKGYDGPTGYVKERSAKAFAQLVTISAISSIENETGTSHEYHVHLSDSSSYMPAAEDLFAAEEEALLRAEAKAAIERKQLEGNAEYLKKQTTKNFSWNAGYHLRCAKTAHKEAELHERKAVLCKARAKDGT